MKHPFSLDAIGLQDYIRATAGLSKGEADPRNGMHPFITISRQTGSGGHTLAEAIIQEMDKFPNEEPLQGWRILDQELCRQVMDDPALKTSMQYLLTERFQKEIKDTFSQILAGASPQIAVFHKIAKLIRAFATMGKVIIVGRAGSFLTRDLPLGIHVRLVSPRTSRVRTMMRQFGWSQWEAEREVDEQDASKALLVKTYFSGKDINDPLHYDAVWNTGRVGIPEIASILVGMARQKIRSAGYFKLPGWDQIIAAAHPSEHSKDARLFLPKTISE